MQVIIAFTNFFESGIIMKSLRYFFLIGIISILLSSKTNAQWQLSTGIDGAAITCFEIDSINYTPPALFAGTYLGLYRSTNSGDSWELLNELHKDDNTYKNFEFFYVNQILIKQNEMYASTTKGVFLSTNLGNNWSLVYSNPSALIYNLVSPNNTPNLLYVYDFTSIQRTKDKGKNWTTLAAPSPVSNYLTHLFSHQNSIYFLGLNGLYISNDEGENWINNPQFANIFITSWQSYNNRIYASIVNLNNQYLFGFSDDNALNWKVFNFNNSNFIIRDISAYQNELYIRTDSKIYVNQITSLEDLSIPWQEYDRTGYNAKHSVLYSGPGLIFHGSNVYQASDVGIYRKNLDNAWEIKNSGMTDLLQVVSNSFYGNVFVEKIQDKDNFFASVSNGIYSTSNNGNSWFLQSGKENSKLNKKIRKTNDTLYLSNFNSLMISTNHGIDWNEYVSTSKNNLEIEDALLVNGNIVAFGQFGGSNYILNSSNKGQTWNLYKSPTDLNNPRNFPDKNSLENIDNTIFDLTNDGTQTALFKISNNDANWTPIWLSKDTIISNYTIHNKIIYISTNKGVFQSTNLGTTWSLFTLKDQNVSGFYIVASNFVATLNLDNLQNRDIVLSYNQGATWKSIKKNLNFISKSEISGNDSVLFLPNPKGIYSFDLVSNIINLNIKGDNIVCVNSSKTYTSNRIDSDFTYKWSVEGGNIIGSNSDSKINVNWNESLNSSTGKIFLIVTNLKTNFTDSTQLSVYINKAEKPIISGDLTYCQNGVSKYTTETRLGFINKWIVSGGKLLSPDYESTIFVEWGVTSSGKIELIQSLVDNECKLSSTSSIDLVADPIPSPNIEGKLIVCENQTETYTSANVANHTYKWIVNGGTIIGADNSNSVQVKWGTLAYSSISLIEYNKTNCSYKTEKNVHINGFGLDIMGDFSACLNDTVYYSVPGSEGLSKKWTISTKSVKLIGSDTDQVLKVIWTSPFSKNISVNIQSPNDECNFQISKSISSPKYYATISIPQIEVSPSKQKNEIFELPVLIQNAHCLTNSNKPDSISFEITLNKNVFYPLQQENIKFSDNGNRRTISIKIPFPDISNNDTLFKIKGYLLLADSIDNFVQISNHTWTKKISANINTSLQNGKIKLIDIADDYAGLRLLAPKTLSLENIIPNPVSDKFTIIVNNNSDEKNATLSLSDNLGNQIFDMSIKLTKGLNEIQSELPAYLANGNYKLVIKNNNSIVKGSIILVR